MENSTWELSFERDNPFVFTILSVTVASTVVLGLIGNSMTIYTIVSEKSLRMTSNILIASLAVADCATTMVTLPIIYVRLQFPQFSFDTKLFCIGSTYLLIPFKAAAIFHLELIAVNRYHLITRPRHRYNQLWGKWNTGSRVAGMWVLSGIITLLPLVGFGEVGFQENDCGIIFTNRSSWWYVSLMFLIVFQVSVIVSPVCFLLVLKKLHDSRERTSAFKQKTAQSRGISKEELVITKMVMLMFLFFVVSWLPYVATHLLSAYLDIPNVLGENVRIFALSSSSFNAVIYAATNRHFRRSFSIWFPFRRSADPTTVNI